MSAVQVSTADVCAHPILAEATVFGVTTIRHAPVSGVDLVVPARVLDAALTHRGVAVLALDAAGPADHRSHLIDVALRRAASAGSTTLIVVGSETTLPEATRALAEHLGLPLLITPPSLSSTEVVVALRELVGAPQQALATTLIGIAGRLARSPRQLADIVSILESALAGATVYVCAGADLVLAGTPRLTSPAEAVRHRSPGELLGDGHVAAVLPVEGITGDIALWLVAERPRAGRLWLNAAAAGLSLCSSVALTWLAREQARHDRDARTRSALLTEILESGRGISRAVAEQAARVGWQLDGWHTGIHFRFTPAVPSALTVLTLADQLERTGLKAHSLVERTDGWSAWLTTARDPGPERARDIARKLEHDLRATPAGHALAVGIGSPQRDVEGIALTLAEARQAALIASTSAKPVSVRVLQEVGPSRLLLGWYSSEAFADYSAELLGPLVTSDEPELLRTLEAYLERACSASHTARALGVHRNTVTQRIAKAERLLGTSTGNADSRLAIQLALRVVRARSS